MVRASYDKMGLQGQEESLKLLQKYNWFAKMRQNVKKYMDARVECTYHKVVASEMEGDMLWNI